MEYKIKPALLIIDLQNGFVSRGGSFDKLGYKIGKYQKIVPIISKIYDKCKSLEIPVIFTIAVREKSGNDMLNKTHKILPKIRLERAVKNPLCVKGSWDAEIVDEMKKKMRDLIILKKRDSAFQDTDMDLQLKSLGVDTLLFVGVDTAICVESSLRDGFNKGWDIILLSNATASLKPNFYKNTLEETKENFGLVLNSKKFFDNLRKEKNYFILKINN